MVRNYNDFAKALLDAGFSIQKTSFPKKPQGCCDKLEIPATQAVKLE